jgi:hypothetical protein
MQVFKKGVPSGEVPEGENVPGLLDMYIYREKV